MLNPDNFTPSFMAEYCEGAVRLAEKKIHELELYYREHPDTRIKLLPRLATGGHFTGLHVWDACLNTIWGKYYMSRLPVTTTLDNFYNLQERDGYICREYQANGKTFWSRKHPICNNPALFAWAELDMASNGATDLKRLKQVYPHIRKHHEFCWKTFRREDGLFFGDAMGCGMDNTPRLPKTGDYDLHAGIPIRYQHVLADNKGIWFGSLKHNPLHCWNKQMGWIDFSAIMAFNALNLAKIADAIGETTDAKLFRQQHADMKTIINKLCWDDTLGFYFDYFNGTTIHRYCAQPFWVLIAEVATPERARRMAEVMKNPDLYDRPVPLPTLAPCEPEFEPENGYMLGAVWAPMVYIALHGLRRYGLDETALYFARKYYNANAELYRKYGTVFENLSCEQFDHPKNHADRDYCGFGNLTPIAIYKEFLN